jgi:peptidoglycan/LPS O-acetylase OafA/YrhL
VANSDHGKIAALESLRGLLALWVVLGHLLTVSGLDAGSWTGLLKLFAHGAYAVEVFIILSGFIIWMLLDRSRESFPAFIIRRFFRLFPVYFLCLIAAIGIMPLAVEALRELPWDNAQNSERLKIFADSAAYFFPHVVAHVFMIHGMFPDNVLPSSPYAFAGQAWSISLEWQFYLIAPLLYWWSARGPWAFAILSVTALAMHYLTLDWPTASLPPQLFLFMIGMLSYEVWRQREKLPSAYVVWLLPAALVLAVASRMPALLVWTLVYFLMLATYCGTGGPIVGIVMRTLEHRHFRFLGEISYSLYLSHMVVLYLAMYLLAPYALILGKGGHFAILAACVLCASVGGSYLLHRYIERPGIQAGRRLASRYRDPIASLVNAETKVHT